MTITLKMNFKILFIGCRLATMPLILFKTLTLDFLLKMRFMSQDVGRFLKTT